MLKKHFQYRLTTIGFEINIMDRCCVCKQQRIRSGLQARPVWKHNESVLLLHIITHTDRIRTADGACVNQAWERIARCMRTEEVERAWESTSISAIPPILPLIDNELWLPGKTGHLVTQSLTLRVLRPLFQIASSRFGSLSIRWSWHTETRYANAPYPETETYILKYKTVNLAYRMYF